MRCLPRVGCCLGLALSCARPPSPIPLGGEEWVRPERHVDRRPRSESDASPERDARSASELARKRSASASRERKPEPASAKASSSPASAALPREVTLGLAPLVAGARVTVRTKYTVRATLVLGADEGGTTQTIEADAAERIAVRIVRAGEDGVREVDLEYVESKAKLSLDGVPEPDESNAGERYTVVFESGTPRVLKRSGSLEPDEDRGVLFDLATVTGYLPLVRPHLPRTLSPGAELRLTSAELGRAFGSPPDVSLDGSELVLRGRAPGERPVALFDCRLHAGFERDGIELEAQLAGTLSVLVTETRPLELSLRGSLRAEPGALGPGSSLSGTATVELVHDYAGPS